MEATTSFDSEVVEVGDAAAVAAPVDPPDVVVDGAARGEEGVGAARAAVQLALGVRLAHVPLRQSGKGRLGTHQQMELPCANYGQVRECILLPLVLQDGQAALRLSLLLTKNWLHSAIAAKQLRQFGQISTCQVSSVNDSPRK